MKRKYRNNSRYAEYVCQYVSPDGVPCGAQCYGTKSSKYCGDHKIVVNKRQMKEYKARCKEKKKSLTLDSTGQRTPANPALYINVQYCDFCRLPFVPDAPGVEVCRCADPRPTADRIEFRRLETYNPATHRKTVITDIQPRYAALNWKTRVNHD